MIRHISNVSHNHYDVLGVKPTATSKEIKNAFYTLSKKFHPDIACGSSSVNDFMLIKNAYDVLKDPKKRQEYDERLSVGHRLSKVWYPSSSSWRFPGSSKGWNEYSDVEKEKIFEYVRKLHQSENFRDHQETLQRRAFEDHLKHRYQRELNRSYRFAGHSGSINYSLLNTLLTAYLASFFAVVIVHIFLSQTGWYEYHSHIQKEADREKWKKAVKKYDERRVKEMMSKPPVYRSPHVYSLCLHMANFLSPRTEEKASGRCFC
ncbi:hypothetical protein AB6A40_005313 [Gnathostoma spinigerum]|uniref:J domain-containing protein n=1 Tax=Gnathostoma spinigerum TaxID=75299 RepID=A0ABD6EMQ7_9BILA